jgi:hypothetical protein
MPTYSVSCQVELYPERRTLGLLVWRAGEIAYFGARGREAHAATVTDGIAHSLAAGRTQDELIAHYLECGGGGYLSFSVPEEVEAPSLSEAARAAAAHHFDIDVVVPEPFSRTPERAVVPEPESRTTENRLS